MRDCDKYINSSTISETQRAKEIEYKNYVDTHIKNVETAFNRLTALPEFYNVIESHNHNFAASLYIHLLSIQIAKHDNSKYDDPEWEAYRRYYYPVDDDEKKAAERDADIAWEHHYQNNPHHWDYWYYTNSIENMPLSYIIEECCDWIAMSMVFPGTALEFYKEKCLNKGEIKLGEFQKMVTEKILTLYYEHYSK